LCRPLALATGVAIFALVLAVPQHPGAARTATLPTQAEAIPHNGPCWSVLSFAAMSGGAGRTCATPGAPLVWTVATGNAGVVRLYGYRDAVARGFRVRIDGLEAATGALTGPDAPSALFFTSPPLPAGPHTFELEWVTSAGGLTLDLYDVQGSSTSRSTTTTTTGPPPAGGGVCPIAPADGEAAIAAAIRSCPNGSTVQFPTRSVYHHADAIEVNDRSNLIIDGGGSTFISSAPNTSEVRPSWRLLRARTVTIRNMTVEGNFKSSGPRSLPAVASIAPNQRNSGFAVHGGDGVTITDVSIRDVFGDMVLVVPSGWTPSDANVGSEIPRNVRIVRLLGTRAARQCVAPTAVIGFWLEDSTLRDCWYGGVDFERDAVGEPHHDAHVLRNTFDGFNLFAITASFPGATGDTNGLEVRGNKIITPGDTCIAPILVGYYPDNPNRMLKVVVEDNEVKALAHGITYDHVEGGSIRNNHVEKTAPDTLCGPPAPQAIKVTNSTNVVVSSNTTAGYSQ
jgi:hypothetical protein